MKVSSAMEDLIDLSLLMKFLGLIAPSVDTVLLDISEDASALPVILDSIKEP